MNEHPADVHPAREGRSTIAVGVEGSVASLAALRFAVDLAGRTGRSCRAVQVWGQPDRVLPVGSGSDVHADPDASRADAARLLNDTVRPYRSRLPTLTLEAALHQGHIVQALIHESESAEALVLGGHKTDPQHHPEVGSATSGVLHHARCPVIVVPELRYRPNSLG